MRLMEALVNLQPPTDDVKVFTGVGKLGTAFEALRLEQSSRRYSMHQCQMYRGDSQSELLAEFSLASKKGAKISENMHNIPLLFAPFAMI